MQNTAVGAINMNTFTHNTDSGKGSVINQARKPTADSTAYTLYKNGGNKNARAKFSSNASVDGESPQIAFSDQSQPMGDKVGGYSTNPITTATRFFNPSK